MFGNGSPELKLGLEDWNFINQTQVLGVTLGGSSEWGRNTLEATRSAVNEWSDAGVSFKAKSVIVNTVIIPKIIAVNKF